MAKSPYRPFEPNPDQLALLPSVSGNAINGMGESKFRRAKPIYWHDPATLHHGELQKWFYTQNPDSKAINKAREERAKILDIEVPPVCGKPLQQSAELWSDDLAKYASTLDMEFLALQSSGRNGHLKEQTSHKSG